MKSNSMDLLKNDQVVFWVKCDEGALNPSNGLDITATFDIDRIFQRSQWVFLFIISNPTGRK